MMIVVQGGSDPAYNAALSAMFEERKRVFVDLLKWDVPVLVGRYEIDRFDNKQATYLIILDQNNEHRASARLLPTERPHLLDTVFPHLCNAAPPTGSSIREITRFCLSRRLKAAERRIARNQLLTAFVEYGLMSGISSYTAIAELPWLQQLLSFGWDCRPLGLPRPDGAHLLSALQIHITPETPQLMADAGTWAPTPCNLTVREVA